MSRFLFPKWSNLLLPTLLLVGAILPMYAVFFVAYGFSPTTLETGYQPVQSVPYSHALHAGELGIDCRYCHNTVEYSSFAALPPTQTCMNCHTAIRPTSPKLALVIESNESGKPIEWIKVHKLGDYSYFDHSAHVNRGVGCVTCHGRVDRMEIVHQHSSLAMGWCLNCHRDPVDNLRPVSEMTNMAFDPMAALTAEERESLQRQYHISPSDQCSTCHR
ncbi:MAG: cytochrome c3 family protein [Phycisphaerae bacterium]|nr:cytochrome c3 family protein [Phycisphaerae bacterium]